MAGKLRSIKTGVPRAKTTGRIKLICGCGGDDEVNYQFRLIEVDGRVEAECLDCLCELEPFYTAEATNAMVSAAVAKAREEWEAEHGAT